jgi:hypothetical protein
LGISACLGLGVFAIYANGIFFKGRYLLDFLNTGTYHVCVLIWFYYLILPLRPSTATVPPFSETKANEPDPPNIRRLAPASLFWKADLKGCLLRIPNSQESNVTFPAG